MPPDMAINMRRSKLKASEVALLSGELKKPSWESRNEGIHERVSFEDSIWGFDLAGGSFYKTPLRVVSVKPDSRAEKAGIRKGDKLKRINDIDTSTLTIQEAHKIIIDSGVHLKIAVTAPEDEEDAYFCYEDPLEDGYDSEEERRKEQEKAKKREVHAKVSSYWSLQWPWVSKRRVIYRESNCFMVPSKYENNHKDMFTPLPLMKIQEDIVLDSIQSELDSKKQEKDSKANNDNSVVNGTIPSPTNHEPLTNGDVSDQEVSANGIDDVPEIAEHTEEEEGLSSLTEEISQSEEALESKDDSQIDDSVDNSNVESAATEPTHEVDTNDEQSQGDEVSDVKEAASVENSQNDDEMINEMLEGDESVSKEAEENILESILSDSETHNSSHDDER